MKIYREIGSLPIVNREDAEGYVRPVYSIEVEEAVPIEDYQSMEQTVDKLIKALADAEPIKHGRWLTNIHCRTVCSECGFRPETETDYCPSCGAKMDVNQIVNQTVNQVSTKL